MPITIEEFVRRWAPCNSYQSPLGPYLQFQKDLKKLVSGEVAKSSDDSEKCAELASLVDAELTRRCEDCHVLDLLPNEVRSVLL